MDVEHFNQLVQMEGWSPDGVELKSRAPRLDFWISTLSLIGAASFTYLAPPRLPLDSFNEWVAILALGSAAFSCAYFLWQNGLSKPSLIINRETIIQKIDGRFEEYRWNSCGEIVPDRFFSFIVCNYKGEALHRSRLFSEKITAQTKFKCIHPEVCHGKNSPM